MNEQREKSAVGPQTTARIIHAAIAAGLVIVFAVFLYLTGRAAMEAAGDAGRLLRIIGYFVLVGSVVTTLALRGRLAPLQSGEDVGLWWTNNLPMAVTVWALAEGGGLAALVLGWVVGDITLMALGAAVGLALLFVNRPGRLERG